MQKNSYMLIAVGLVLLVALAVGGFLFLRNSSGNSSSSTSNDTNTVSIKNMAFSNSTLTVKVGTTVTWKNEDSIQHIVTSDAGDFVSSTLSKNDTFQHTFSTTGEFSYHCSIHPEMTGKVIVE